MRSACSPHTPSLRPSPAGGRGSVALLWPLFLAACGSPPVENRAEPPTQNLSQTVATQSQAPKIPCAAPGGGDLTPACTLDRDETPEGVVLTLRHPDGAFHRLQITRDGRGVIAADGAEPAKVTPLASDRIEVELGGARYRLPATVRGQTQ